jgi:hypothetical protein
MEHAIGHLVALAITNDAVEVSTPYASSLQLSSLTNAYDNKVAALASQTAEPEHLFTKFDLYVGNTMAHYRSAYL